MRRFCTWWFDDFVKVFDFWIGGRPVKDYITSSDHLETSKIPLRPFFAFRFLTTVSSFTSERAKIKRWRSNFGCLLIFLGIGAVSCGGWSSWPTSSHQPTGNIFGLSSPIHWSYSESHPSKWMQRRLPTTLKKSEKSHLISKRVYKLNISNFYKFNLATLG